MGSQRVGHDWTTELNRTDSWLTNNVVIVWGEQWRDSAIHIYVSIVPQIPFPFTPPHNTEQSSTYYTVLLVIHFKYNSIYKSIPNSLTIPCSHPSPKKPEVHSLNLWVFFCFVRELICIFLFRFHIRDAIQYETFCLISLIMTVSRGCIHIPANDIISFFLMDE